MSHDRASCLVVLLFAACASDPPPPPGAPDAAATDAPAAVPVDGRGEIDATEHLDAAALGGGHWEERAHLLEPNSECAVAELDRHIYAIGGYPPDRVTVDTVQVYDVATGTWGLTTPLPQPLNHTVAAAAMGRLYVIGGQTDASTGSFVDDVYAYDPASESWSPRAPMPTARSAAASAVIGDLIYVAGGRPPHGQDFAVYDAARDAWTALPPMPTGRNHLAVAAIDGLVYVAGGRFDAGFTSEATDTLELYDPATSTWSSRAPMPTARGGVNGIAVGGCFYVWGGEHADGVWAENEVYHAATNSWRSLAPLPIPVHGVTGAAFVDGWIYAPGGGTVQGGSSGSTYLQVFDTAGTCPM